MKWDKDKLKAILKNKYTKSVLFFGFYFVFFMVILSMMSPNDVSEGEKTNINMWDNITNNYEYLYEIKLSDNQIISMEGKKYNNKNLFTKSVNGIVDSEVYIFYDDISIKKDGIWSDGNSFGIIDYIFDEKYLDIDYIIRYIKELVADSELIDSKTNFDESRSDIYKFGNLDIEVISSQNILKKVTIIEPACTLAIQYRNINNVKDFVVEK